MLWWSMLRVLRLTGGIGARTAVNTHVTSIREDPEDQSMTSATSANQKKKSKNVGCRDHKTHGFFPHALNTSQLSMRRSRF